MEAGPADAGEAGEGGEASTDAPTTDAPIQDTGTDTNMGMDTGIADAGDAG
jgi:hypothetical protein